MQFICKQLWESASMGSENGRRGLGSGYAGLRAGSRNGWSGFRPKWRCASRAGLVGRAEPSKLFLLRAGRHDGRLSRVIGLCFGRRLLASAAARFGGLNSF